MTTRRVASVEETVAAGEELGRQLKPGDVVALCGELGTGKTRFVSGICRSLGIRAAITSPTFTIVHEYQAHSGLVAHIDLYRVNSREELKEVGVEAYFTDSCICLIEWAGRARSILPAGHYSVSFRYGREENEREIDITSPETAPA